MRKRVFGYNGCMDFFFTDGTIEHLHPADTRLLGLQADPFPDGKRLRIALDLTPFHQKPYLELILTDSSGKVIAATSIIEPVAWRLELTLHLLKPNPIPGGVYTLTVSLSYPDLGEIDHREIIVEIPSPKA